MLSQLTQHLPLTTFRRCVAKYDGEHKVKSFSCLDQYLSMAFAQLTFRESLRDIEACLRAQIAKLYRQRWQIELFFKWIKQHLRIKSFFGTSENAVKAQVWIAVSTYVFVAIVKKRLNLTASLYEILQILSLTMFEQMPLDQLLSKSTLDQTMHDTANQLNLFD